MSAKDRPQSVAQWRQALEGGLIKGPAKPAEKPKTKKSSPAASSLPVKQIAIAAVLILVLVVGGVFGWPAWQERQARLAQENQARIAKQAELKKQQEQARIAKQAALKKAKQAALKKAKQAALKKAQEEVRRKRAAAYGVGKTFRDCAQCPEMVVVPAGSFMMGSPPSETGRLSYEGPQHRVTIAKPFALGKFEVTFDEWDACLAGGVCKRRKRRAWWGRGRRAVINISWHDAKDFVAWLRRKTGKSYRLLSESEWEYAARAGTQTPFSTGRAIAPSQANFNGKLSYNGSPTGRYHSKVIEVGSYKPNAFGLYDMHGNVSEWVEDCSPYSYKGAPRDGSARLNDNRNCGSRILRGGNWIDDPKYLRSAYRKMYSKTYRNSNIGIRVALSIAPLSKAQQQNPKSQPQRTAGPKLTWQRIYKVPNFTGLNSVIALPGASFVAAGHGDTDPGTKLNVDGWIIKMDKNGRF